MKAFVCLLIFLCAVPVAGQEATDEPFPLEGWFEATADGFSLIGSSARTTVVHNLMQPVYDHMAANTGSQPTIKLVITQDGVLPGCGSPASDEQTAEPCAESDVDLHGYELIEVPDGARVEEVLTRALFERFYPAERFPAWFAAGMVDLYAPTPKADRLTLTRDAARANRGFTAAQLETSNPDPTWRLQVYSLILYIIDRAGIDGLMALANDRGAFSAAYERSTGEPLIDLIPNWQNWIFTRAAETAYVSDHLAPPTLTPSATFTATLTRTPTLTPTVTATATPSRVPTITPSFTPSPRPATVTPRPPGSLDATPPASPAAPLTIDGTTQAVLIGGLVILLVVLLVGYLRLGKR
jgi:hypothetical protein